MRKGTMEEFLSAYGSKINTLKELEIEGTVRGDELSCRNDEQDGRHTAAVCQRAAHDFGVLVGFRDAERYSGPVLSIDEARGEEASVQDESGGDSPAVARGVCEVSPGGVFHRDERLLGHGDHRAGAAHDIRAISVASFPEHRR